MAGTRAGGIKAGVTNKRRYGKEFYPLIAVKGGSVKVNKGFAISKQTAASAGRLGGTRAIFVRFGAPKGREVISPYQAEVLVALLSGPKGYAEIKGSRDSLRSIRRLIRRGYVISQRFQFALTPDGVAKAKTYQSTIWKRLSKMVWGRGIPVALIYAGAVQLYWLQVNHVLFGVHVA